ncbi:MAG: sodium:calcium antiporter [Candidatus Eremiobacteraeota bacterium]|nr:sodium:calcium antiporter [Candidatus Eremiobacteraeota bacterium]
MSSLATPLIIGLFVVAGAVIWWSGAILAGTTDAIDAHFGWGEGLGGAVLLAISTNLPEVAIIVGGAWSHSLSLAVGNILGGIAIQTVVLAYLDGPALRNRVPLSSSVSSLTIALESFVLIAILMLCILGTLSPRSLVIARTTPAELAILATWIGGLWLIRHNEDRQVWHVAREAVAERTPAVNAAHRPMTQVFVWFAVAALATLMAGVVLALTSSVAADRFHIGGVIFGATFLAATTALPELTTGLYAVRAGRYELAMSDIVAGNAFLPVLFLFGTLLSGQALLPAAQGPDLYLTALGGLLTAVYGAGVIVRSKRMVWGAGIDSILVFVLYAIGIAGLFVIAR